MQRGGTALRMASVRRARIPEGVLTEWKGCRLEIDFFFAEIPLQSVGMIIFWYGGGGRQESECADRGKETGLLRTWIHVDRCRL